MLKVKLLSETATVPTLGDPHAAGYDLYCSEATCIPSHTRQLVKTDIAIEIPDGHYGRIASRSSIASKKMVDVGAGVIDRSYRGEVKVLLYNTSDTEFVINVNDRIAQIVLEKYSTFPIQVVDVLSDTERGDGGFGSTGK